MIGLPRFFIYYALLLGTWGSIHFHPERIVPVARSLCEFPVKFDEWQMVFQSRFSSEVLDLLKPSDYVSRQYTGADGSIVKVYIGYHDGGRNSGEIHSPKHCLPGSGWQEIASDPMELDLRGGRVNLVKAVYQKGENRELFFYWFQVHGKTLSNEYALKAAEVMNSLVFRRRDAAFIRVSIQFQDDEGRAERTGLNFIHDLYPVIGNYLPG